jgi:hypothetical protein
MDDYKKGAAHVGWGRKERKMAKDKARAALKTKDLLEALEAGGYNAKPGKLRQGCIMAVFHDEQGNPREGTDEEWDKLYEDAKKESERFASVKDRMEALLKDDDEAG